MQQLVLPLVPRPRLTRTDFIAAPGNERVLRFLESWPHWPAPAAALYGPAASGKSHLVQIWAALSGAVVIAAADLAEIPAKIPEGPAAVEDIDAAPGEGHERALFALFERGTPLLLTGRTPPATWRVGMPDLASRYRAALAFDLGAPDDARQASSPEAIRDVVAAADARALSEKRPINPGLIREMLAAPL